MLVPLMSVGMFFVTGYTVSAQNSDTGIREAKGCQEVISTMKAAIAKEPGRLIICMEDALTTQESCICVIIREAVSYAGEDHLLVGQLVVAAIRMVPSAAAKIAECAMMESPGAAPSVRAALSKELGKPAGNWLETTDGQAPTSSEEPSAVVPSAQNIPTEEKTGKEPAGKALVEEKEDSGENLEEPMDFAWPDVGVSGIFLASPARSGQSQRPEKHPNIPTITIITTKITPRRPVLPVTRSSPD